MPPPNRLRQIRASRHQVAGADEHRADRGAEPLGQADAHGVELRAVGRERDAGGDVGVPEPGTVEVHRDPPRLGAGAQRLDLVERLDRAAAEVVGVLDDDQRAC